MNAAAKKSNKMIKKWPITFDNMEVIGEINENRMSSFLKVFHISLSLK